jgi:hypothetical protein
MMMMMMMMMMMRGNIGLTLAYHAGLSPVQARFNLLRDLF